MNKIKILYVYKTTQKKTSIEINFQMDWHTIFVVVVWKSCLLTLVLQLNGNKNYGEYY